MGCLYLTMSSPEVSGYQGNGSRIKDDGTNGFNDELIHYGGNTRFMIRLCRRVFALCPC